jgi:hypothetical protein
MSRYHIQSSLAGGGGSSCVAVMIVDNATRFLFISTVSSGLSRKLRMFPFLFKGVAGGRRAPASSRSRSCLVLNAHDCSVFVAVNVVDNATHKMFVV